MGLRGSDVLDLVIDVGNHRAKAGLFLDGRLLEQEVMTPGDMKALHALLRGRRPRRIACGSVAGEIAWGTALTSIAQLTTLHGGSPSPLVSDYDTQATLGVDRLANAVAAWRTFPKRPSMSIDLGSCITIDLVSAEGHYLGGGISPGMHMRARAMHAYSARLPEADLDQPVKIPGTSTMGSLVTGIHEGIRHELDGWIRERRQRSPDLAIVLTGGDAPRFARALKSGIFADPSLTLRGLHALLEHTTPSPGPGPLHR